MGAEPVGIGERVFAMSSAFDTRKHGGPDAEVIGSCGAYDVRRQLDSVATPAAYTRFGERNFKSHYPGLGK